MRSCEYSTTTKGVEKRTHILQKGDILFNRKCRKISNGSGILHLEDKVSPKPRTQKIGVKNATVTQWRTATTLCSVRIWAEIIIQLDSYSGTTRDTPVNMVWVEHQKTTRTSHMTTKSMRSDTLLFHEERLGFHTKMWAPTPFVKGFPWKSIWTKCTWKQS